MVTFMDFLISGWLGCETWCFFFGGGGGDDLVY